MKKISQFDKECLEMAIEVAKKTYQSGNYPVGAVLAIDGKIIDKAGNETNKHKSSVNHAENNLIIKNGKLLRSACEKGKIISLYSTLEPCVQCLGASVTNRVNRIVFIERDPNGGASDLKHDNVGLFYKEFWPEIVHYSYSDKPKKMMIKFFHEEIERGNIEWPKRMLKLLQNN